MSATIVFSGNHYLFLNQLSQNQYLKIQGCLHKCVPINPDPPIIDNFLFMH